MVNNKAAYFCGAGTVKVNGGKVAWVRWQYEVTNFAEAFFKSVQGLFFPEYELTQKMIEKKYCELYLNDVNCGYLIPINSAEFIKRRSHLFNNITSIFFDEIQPENNGYVPDELNKFLIWLKKDFDLKEYYRGLIITRQFMNSIENVVLDSETNKNRKRCHLIQQSNQQFPPHFDCVALI